MTAVPMIIGLVVNDIYVSPGKQVSLVAYAVGGFVPLVTGTLVLLPTLEVFVPLVSSPTYLDWLR